MKRTPTPALLLTLGLSLAACGGKKGSDASSSSKADADKTESSAAPKSSIPKPSLDGGFAGPALGAADAIEPPSRDILPGMSVKQAKDKGAKPGTVDYLLKWRPDTELWIDKGTEVVENLRVEYPAKDMDGIKAKWGKPTFGDDVWVGANFAAKIEGCGDTCTVSFMRPPLPFLSDKPVPPGVLGNLKAGMTAEEVKTATGIALYEGPGVSNGYAWDVWVDYHDKKLDSLTMNNRIGDSEYWTSTLTKRWGATQTIDGKTVWLSAEAGWLTELGTNGWLLTFHPMTSVKKLLAKSGDESLIALAKATVGKKRDGLASVKGLNEKNESLVPCAANEYALTCPSLILDVGEENKVQALEVRFGVDDDAAAAKLIKEISDAWGAMTKKKNDADEEIQTVSVEGFEVSILVSGNVRVTLTKK